MNKQNKLVTYLKKKVGYLQEIKNAHKQLQDEQKEIETSVKDIIKDNLGIKTPKYIITWKNQTTTKFDTVKTPSRKT